MSFSEQLSALRLKHKPQNDNNFYSNTINDLAAVPHTHHIGCAVLQLSIIWLLTELNSNH